jgi:predicted RNA-binding protein with PUA-like domain
MNFFLAKTDPSTYSIENLAEEGVTTWSGVRNPQAVQALKAMKKGDRVFIYHSEGEGAIRGLASVVGNSRPDPEDDRSWLVDFKFVRAFREPYVTLKAVKAEKRFKNFALVKQSRLSTMAVPENFVAWLRERGLKI